MYTLPVVLAGQLQYQSRLTVGLSSKVTQCSLKVCNFSLIDVYNSNGSITTLYVLRYQHVFEKNSTYKVDSFNNIMFVVLSTFVHVSTTLGTQSTVFFKFLIDVQIVVTKQVILIVKTSFNEDAY